MAVSLTSIQLDTRLADEAAKVLGAKSRTEAVHMALREIVALKRFKTSMKKHGGKLRFRSAAAAFPVPRSPQPRATVSSGATS